MTRFIPILLAITFAVGPLEAQSGYDLFQKALATERADGNLRAAIQLYERIVKEFGADRALAARALVRKADCLLKLGDEEARSSHSCRPCRGKSEKA